MLKQPLITAIKRNSLDDGPGIRSVVFFKGCPLSCRWCHNPESISAFPEIAFDAPACIACASCIRVCQRGALSSENPFFVDRNQCRRCYDCVEICPAGALSRVGRSLSIDDIVQILLKDKSFYENSGGGVTLSGGEPLMFSQFTSALSAVLKNAGIHTIVETCGQFSLSEFEACVAPFVDTLFYDIKLMDAKEHRYYCSVSNEVILENFRQLQKRALHGEIELLPRIPLIPGITDSKRNLHSVADFFEACRVTRAQLLAYHPLWPAKARQVGRADVLEPNDAWMHFSGQDTLEACRCVFESRGILII